jgi:SAM-dependent methyltransferase
METPMTGMPQPGPKELDLDTPSPARIYDYSLGGSHNFKVDREFADRVFRYVPWVPNINRLNRSFLWRVVRYYLDQGITQFLDLGSGIPTVGNVHEVAQQVVPDARVVYVDYEPLAYEYAKLLLKDNPHAAIIHADIRQPETILEHPETRRLLDFDQPLGLLMVGVLLFIAPEDNPAGLVRTYRQRLASGSLLAISHLCDEQAPPQQRQQVAEAVAFYQHATEQLHVRGRQEITSWFEGMQLVDPGLVFLPDWRPETDREDNDPARLLGYGAVARQP